MFLSSQIVELVVKMRFDTKHHPKGALTHHSLCGRWYCLAAVVRSPKGEDAMSIRAADAFLFGSVFHAVSVPKLPEEESEMLRKIHP